MKAHPPGLLVAVALATITTPAIAEVVLQPLAGTGRQGPSLVANDGFEESDGALPAGWRSNLSPGVMIDRRCTQSGGASIRFQKSASDKGLWLSRNVEINQKTAAPLLLSGWSKAEGVEDRPGSDYSVWADLQYVDGTSLYGQRALFDPSTHDWQRSERASGGVTVI